MKTIIDDYNYQTLIGDGKTVVANGERRMLSALPPDANYQKRKLAKAFGASTVRKIPRSDWSGLIKEQKTQRRRCSDFQKFRATNQGSLPTCWAAGTCHAYMTKRVMQGLPLVFISPCSIAVPISGGNSGGYEGDAVNYFLKYGGVDEQLWGATDRRRLDSDSKVAENRKLYKAIIAVELNGFDEFASALLQGYPCTVSYNWWSHVIMLADLLEIEAGSFGVFGRNNWGEWGDKNDYGYSGYVAMREGRGTPSGGYCFQEVYMSVAA